MSQAITDDHNFVYERNGKIGNAKFEDVKERIKKRTMDCNILAAFRYEAKGIRMDDDEIRRRIGKILDSRRGEKILEEYWWDADTRQQRIIRDEVEKRLSNRCKKTCKSMVYATTDSRRADYVQWIYTVQGQKSTINRAGKQYRISISKNSKSRIYGTDLWRGEYSGEAYCFEVPSGHLVFRKDGRIFYQGIVVKHR